MKVPLILPTFLVSVVTVRSSKYSSAVEVSSSSFLSSAKSTETIPATGFVAGSASAHFGSIVFEILRKVNKPAQCQKLEFQGIPEKISSPLVGGKVFTITDALYNERFAWTNGKEFLSYVSPGDHGTWLIGNEPGVDSGYVYMKPTYSTLTPTNIESDTLHWHWLLSQKWTPIHEVKVVCLDESPTDHFYEVEYYDPTSKETVHSYFVQSPSTPASGYLFDKVEKTLILVENLKPIASYGVPVIIRKSQTVSTVAVLVNNELSTNGWSLTFRRVPAMNMQEDAQWDFKDEVRVSLAADGTTKSFLLEKLNAEELDANNRQTSALLSTTKRGDYLWIFHSSGPSTNTSFVVSSRGLVTYPTVEEHVESLLLCVASNSTSAIFRSFPADRRIQMQQDQLTRDGDLFVITFDPTGAVAPSMVLHSVSSSVEQVNVLHGLFALGDPVVFLRKHLLEKEGVLGGMSSCYFYHAAVSIPQPLLYAAEILCVLIGSKPVTMIQYVSDSDEQWRFPLVADLAQSIITARLVLGDALDVDYRVHKYENVHSLIFYRPNRQYIVENLLPRDFSQALHPMPYPNRENPEPDWQEQIYNSWWNGYLLGYPERFVDSYCVTFHNDLSEEEKMFEARRAKKDIQQFLDTLNKKAEPIHLGLDPPVNESFWKFVTYSMD